ncbi:MAG: hypothetical protein ACTHJ3_02130 [Pararhizobium sp.]
MDLIDNALRPPEPQLLDTCILQNLDWVDRQLEDKGQVVWDDAALLNLANDYGVEIANDLVDLGVLYKEFEDRGGYPWLVCGVNSTEASRFGGARGLRLNDIVGFFGRHQQDISNKAYPGVPIGMLTATGLLRVSPLILKGLGVGSLDEVFAKDGPLSFLGDEGDRRVAGYAVVSNIPAVLTTDRKTFWKHRERLSDFGVEIIRPSELLVRYEPYWTALAGEFSRRRSESRDASKDWR